MNSKWNKRNELFWIGVSASLLAIMLWDMYKQRTKTFNYSKVHKEIR